MLSGRPIPISDWNGGTTSCRFLGIEVAVSDFEQLFEVRSRLEHRAGDADRGGDVQGGVSDFPLKLRELRGKALGDRAGLFGPETEHEWRFYPSGRLEPVCTFENDDVVKKDADVAIENDDVAKNDDDVAIRDDDVAIEDADVAKKDADVAIENEDVAKKDADVAIENEDIAKRDADVAINDGVNGIRFCGFTRTLV